MGREWGFIVRLQAGAVAAVVTGAGRAGEAGARRRRAGAGHLRGVALRAQTHHLVHHLHRLKHAPRVVPTATA